jgi:hypothetical protein
MNEDTYPVHTELFDVVMVKDGVSHNDAKPEDIKRLPVVASGPLAAQISDEAMAFAAKEGYTAVHATKPGVLTELESLAMRRQMEGSVPDRSKI